MSGIDLFEGFDWKNGKFNQQQEDYIELYAQNQIEAYLTGETDVKKAEKHLKRVMAQLGKEARIVWHESPRSAVWASVRASVGASVRASVWAGVEVSVEVSVWNSVGDSVWNSVEVSVWNSVGDSVWDSVWASVGDSVEVSVWNSVEEWRWAREASFYKFLNDHFKNNELENYCLFSEQVTGSFFGGDGNVHVIKKPTRLIRNAAGRLHYDHGKAIEWADGYGFYYLSGVEFDEDTFNKLVSEEFTLENLGEIKNADQRAVAVQMLRPDRLLKQVGAELINTGVKGTELYRVDNFMDTGETEYCMKMKHPSLDKHYIEWVEPSVGAKRDADLCQAVAFGVPKAVYLAAQEA